MKYAIVALGGFFGAMSRYGLGQVIPANGHFPLGTLIINLLGCLFLGWFSAFIAGKYVSPYITLLMGTGFTGSFTTFSTFSVETIELMRGSHFVAAGSYVVLSVVAGLLFAYVGTRIGLSMKKVSASS